MEELFDLLESRVAALPSGLRSHIDRVRQIARNMAPEHGIDEDLASLAMLAHDVARAMPGQELLLRATEYDLPVGNVERLVPVLLHGPVGAEVLSREDGLADQSIYQSVYWHTTAHPSLDTLGKIVFLADKLDPHKITAYPYQDELRRMAAENLDRAILEFLTRETISLVSRGLMVHPKVIETRNHLLSNLTSAGDIK